MATDTPIPHRSPVPTGSLACGWNTTRRRVALLCLVLSLLLSAGGLPSAIHAQGTAAPEATLSATPTAPAAPFPFVYEDEAPEIGPTAGTLPESGPRDVPPSPGVPAAPVTDALPQTLPLPGFDAQPTMEVFPDAAASTRPGIDGQEPVSDRAISSALQGQFRAFAFLRSALGNVMSGDETILDARGPAPVRDAMRSIWTPEFRAFLGRLWPLLIPLTLFLAILGTWRSAIHEKRRPTRPSASRHPRVLSKAPFRDDWDSAGGFDPDHAVERDPPQVPPQSAARAEVSGPNLPNTRAPTSPITDEAPSPHARVSAPDPVERLLAAAGSSAIPPLRPGTDAPMRVVGLAKDEVLTILAALPADAPSSWDSPDDTPEISIDVSPEDNLTRVFLGADCVAIIQDETDVALDQIALVFTDPPEASPAPRPLAPVVPLDAVRARRRKDMRSMDNAAPPEPADDPTEITFDPDPSTDDPPSRDQPTGKTRPPGARVPSVLTRRGG